MNKETLYQVFSVKIGYFALIILRMMLKQSRTSNNYFYQKQKQNIYNEKEILNNFNNYMGSMTRSHLYPTNSNKLISQFNMKRKKAILKILKKVRITHTENVLDTITFSRDLIDNIDKIMEIFWAVSNKNIFFSDSYNTISKEKKFWEQNMPHWFAKSNLATIAEWIVVHFEMRIYDFYKKYEEDEVYKITCLQKREDYIEIWKRLTLEEKRAMIEKSVACVDKFPKWVLENNDIENNIEKENKDSFEEIAFDFLRNHTNKLNINGLKNFKENMVKKILQKREELGDSNFVRMSVACNLSSAVLLEYFFMAKLVFAFDKLHYKNLFFNDDEEEVLKKKKRRRERKKRKIKMLLLKKRKCRKRFLKMLRIKLIR